MLDEVDTVNKLAKNFSNKSIISVERVTASWTQNAAIETLSDVNVTIPNKGLCAVVGTVGCGKVINIYLLTDLITV